MNNKELIESKIIELGYALGCYDTLINRLDKSEVEKIIKELESEYTDIKVEFNKNIYMIELSTVDNEKDLNMLSISDYIDRYGEIEE